jgi:hypothetical protein
LMRSSTDVALSSCAPGLLHQIVPRHTGTLLRCSHGSPLFDAVAITRSNANLAVLGDLNVRHELGDMHYLQIRILNHNRHEAPNKLTAQALRWFCMLVSLETLETSGWNTCRIILSDCDEQTIGVIF